MRYFDNNTFFWFFIAMIFFLPGLGGVHLFDWDEINFAEIAREMLISGEYLQPQMNFTRFTEKPPLFFWLQAMSMAIFGIGEFAARFPNALLGIITLPVLYISGKFLVDRKFGYLWALSWFGSTLPFMYYKSGIIDPWFNFLIFFSLFFLIHYIWKRQKTHDLYLTRSSRTYVWMAAIFSGVAVLTKGPVAILLIWLTVGLYWILQGFRPLISLRSLLKYALITLLVIFSWFGLDWIVNGPEFLIEFTMRQWELLTTSDAGHKGFPAYHLVVLLLGCFPASIFAFLAIGKWYNMPSYLMEFRKWMVILLFVVVVLFSLVGTKIVHYSSMAYYPISFLSAFGLYRLLEKRVRLHGVIWFFIILLQIIMIAASLSLPFIGENIEQFSYLFEKDPFALANLQADVQWDVLDYLPGFWLLIIIILFIVFWKRSRSSAVKLLFFGNAIWVMGVLYFFIGKIESFSQGAAVEFYKEKAGEKVYVTTYRYKSYVPWFYARVQPYTVQNARDQNWLLYGETDHPVYISTKVTSGAELEKELPDARFLYHKNGFVFYRRN